MTQAFDHKCPRCQTHYTAEQSCDWCPAGSADLRPWIELTDEDRQAAFHSLPDMLDGFLKTWGWLHFAKAIEAKCREKNVGAAPSLSADARDAQRYRWLRETFGTTDTEAQDKALEALNAACGEPASPQEFDAAIDAAMKEQPQ